MDGGPAAPRKLLIKDRRLAALKLRKQGASYRKIAERMLEETAKQGIDIGEYSESQAHRDVMAELKRMNERLAEAADEVRRIDLERLDELLAVHYQKATGAKPDYAALTAVLSIMERRWKIMPGVVAPTSSENIDLSKLSSEQVERLSRGESLYAVLTTPGKGGAGTPEAPTEPAPETASD